MQKNPLLHIGDHHINFTSITEKDIDSATRFIIKETRKQIERIAGLKEKRDRENTLRPYDDAFDFLNSTYSYIYLLAYVHQSEAIRNQCQSSIAGIGKFLNEIGLYEPIYQALKDLTTSDTYKELKPHEKRYLDKQIEDFERNGLALPPEKREELKKIKDKISDLSILFSSNISEYSDHLIVNEDQMTGLPDDYKEERLEDDGTYKIDLSYPSYIPFMKYSESEEARKKLLFKYLNRAAEQNLPVLDELISERNKESKLLGYPNYASHSLEDKMAENPEKVWHFLNDLSTKVNAKANADYERLLFKKKNHTGEAQISNVQYWESSYYSNRILREEYEVDPEKIKEYFELAHVLEGLFRISQTLFGIHITRKEKESAWHPDVHYYEVTENGNILGAFYLDLYPREGKYNHAACFSLINGKQHKTYYQRPRACLVCNFPKPGKEKPSLLLHSDVVTMFHEFGHLLHHLLAQTEYSLQSGISNSRDFVEVPSQFLENYAWNYDALQLFATHYKSNEILPASLFKKMEAAKNLGSGLHNQQQLFYSLYDMSLHDGYTPKSGKSTTALVEEIQNKTTLFPFLEGTHMQASFGHLTGYAAGYYGYLWAKVYAEDIFSVFEENGILDKAWGERLRKEILSKGSSEEESAMIKSFLGREANDEAFIRSLGI